MAVVPGFLVSAIVSKNLDVGRGINAETDDAVVPHLDDHHLDVVADENFAVPSP